MNNNFGDSPTLKSPFYDPLVMMGPPTPETLSESELQQIDSANGFTAKGEEYPDNLTQPPDTAKRSSTDEPSAYDLWPPPPIESNPFCETIAARLYSIEHLKLILKEPVYFQRFHGFLQKHRPQSVATLRRYIDSQKALAAIRYANALAEQLSTVSRKTSSSSKIEAASIDTKFESLSRKAMEELLTQDLPAYITYRMVTLVTECLVKEITGSNTPLMQGLVQGLAEAYCLSDPKQLDCPVVFASEGFYTTTQYCCEYVIGKNCRFLQGPKTQRPAVERISNAIRNGQEISEILLNYRRNGSPFLNLVMMAPLHDSHGHVRYYLGAQVDISHLLEGGRGLESFKHLLDQDRGFAERFKHQSSHLDAKPSLAHLRELRSLLSDEEIEAMKHCDREAHTNGPKRHEPTSSNTNHGRRFVGMDQPEDILWSTSLLEPNGRLPGVYQTYILVRPYPSLRIIFTSPALRIPGLSQSKLMDRIGGTKHVRDSVLDALARGISVTAKITWLTKNARYCDQSTGNAENDTLFADDYDTQPEEGKPRWIHCTPLLGSDGRPGVIMIVMIDREAVDRALTHQRNPVIASRSRNQAISGEDHPLRSQGTRTPTHSNAASIGKLSVSKLYSDHMFREGLQHHEREYGRTGRVNDGIASIHSETQSVHTFQLLDRRGTPVLRSKESFDSTRVGSKSDRDFGGSEKARSKWSGIGLRLRRGHSHIDLRSSGKKAS